MFRLDLLEVTRNDPPYCRSFGMLIVVLKAARCDYFLVTVGEATTAPDENINFLSYRIGTYTNTRTQPR